MIERLISSGILVGTQTNIIENNVLRANSISFTTKDLMDTSLNKDGIFHRLYLFYKTEYFLYNVYFSKLIFNWLQKIRNFQKLKGYKIGYISEMNH